MKRGAGLAPPRPISYLFASTDPATRVSDTGPRHSMTSRTLLPFLLALLLLRAVQSPAQELTPEARRQRQDKLETILRIQDLRTPHDGGLVSALSDPDPVVRERAAFAFGSL